MKNSNILKSTIFSLVLLAGALGASLPESSYIATDSYEPDGSFGQAKVITSGSTQNHNIVPVGDQDWVIFSVTSDLLQVVIETSGPSGDTRIRLFDSSVNLIEFNLNDGMGNFSMIDRMCGVDSLSAGTYYVAINEYGDNAEIAIYNLSLTVTPCLDAYEPDDNSAQAKLIYSGSQQNHSINPAGDEDWVKFSVGVLSQVTVETSGTSGDDTRMWLIDSDIIVMETDDDGGTGSFSKIDRVCGVDALSAGTYYVKINEFEVDGADEIASYNIDLTVTSCLDAYEPDNIAVQAKWISSGNQQNHSINPVGDEDWVKFNVGVLSQVTLQTSGTSGDDTRMWLYDSGLNEIEYNDDIDLVGGNLFSKIDRFCGVDALSAGTYYVKIDEYLGNAVIASYNIDLTISGCPDSYEPDNNSGQATPILDGVQQTHSISPVGDEDWVKFSVGVLSQVTLQTSGTSGDDTRMWLYDSGLNEIGYNDDIDLVGGNLFSKIDRYCGVDALSAGTYYVKIDEYFDNAAIASYNIDLTISACPDSYEPDNNSGEATLILDGVQQTHNISPVGDHDWVKFTLVSDSAVTLETSGLNDDTEMRLYDSGVIEIDYDDNGGTDLFSKIDRICGVDALAAGTYYVEINDSGNNTEIPSYNIDLTISACSTEIFADGFESNDFSAWFGLNTGNGDLNVCAAAAMEGSFGACVDVVSQKRKQVWDQSMTDATRYRARFYFDPNGLSMGNNEKIRLMQLRTGSDTIRPMYVQMRNNGGAYEIRVRAQTDAGVMLSGSWIPIADAAVAIEIDWMAASGAGNNDGYVTLWLDGVEMGTISGIDNDTLVVNEVKLGFTSRLGTKAISGTFYLDAFVSDSVVFIGLLP